MSAKNSQFFQNLSGSRRPGATALLFLALILAGCANALDTTNDELRSSSDGMTHLAMRLQEQGDDAGAAEFYHRALQRKPDDVRALKGMTTVLERGGYHTQAIQYYSHLAKLQPGDLDVRRDFGRVLIKAGRPVDAREQYEAALAIERDDPKSLNGLGVALDLLGNHVGAQDKYKRALAQNEGDLTALSNLGHSYVLSERYEEAIKLLEPHSMNQQAPATLRQNLAQAYSARGMDIDASRVLRPDMSAEQIKKFLATHRAKRDPATGNCEPEKLGTANLGSFGTASLAEAHAARLKAQFPVETQGLVFEVVPRVRAEGGTPDFYLHARGFKNAAAARGFCEEIGKNGVFCKQQ